MFRIEICCSLWAVLCPDPQWFGALERVPEGCRGILPGLVSRMLQGNLRTNQGHFLSQLLHRGRTIVQSGKCTMIHKPKTRKFEGHFFVSAPKAVLVVLSFPTPVWLTSKGKVFRKKVAYLSLRLGTLFGSALLFVDKKKPKGS